MSSAPEPPPREGPSLAALVRASLIVSAVTGAAALVAFGIYQVYRWLV